MRTPSIFSLCLCVFAFFQESHQSIAKYGILAELTYGRLGATYHLCNQELDYAAALEILNTHRRRDPIFGRRFQGEACATVRLGYPKIATIYEAGESAGFHDLAMASLPGQRPGSR